MSIEADTQVIQRNTGTHVRWSSTDARWCWSRGDWGAPRARNGSAWTGRLNQKTWFGISCSDGNRTVHDGVTVVVRDNVDSGSGLSVSIDADPQVIPRNTGTTVRWRSTGARWCWSRGDWGAPRERNGQAWTGRLAEKTWFGISCTDGNRTVHDGVTVVVRDGDGGGGGDVSVSLTASPGTVRVGDSATLRWSSQNATSCSAGGAWSGGRAREGTFQTPSLESNAYYRLTCVNGNQSAVSSVTVQVAQVPVVRWQAPTRNEDGTNLTDLAGYYFHWGTRSGSYPNRQRIWNASATQYRPEQLSPGTYYVALTAVNSDGEESGYSNEIRVEIP